MCNLFLYLKYIDTKKTVANFTHVYDGTIPKEQCNCT